MGKKLTEAALLVLGRMLVDDDLAIFTEKARLERKLYEECAKALESIGGKWNRKREGFVFAENPEDALDQVLLDGEISDAKKEFQFFETPEDLAAQMASHLDIQPGDWVLEPSAGRGRLVRAALVAQPRCRITAIEIQSKLCDGLLGLMVDQARWARDHGGEPLQCSEVLEGNFMEHAVPGDRLYDRAIMNPPFSRQQDVDHIGRALGQLKPGGRLEAIASAAVKTRDNRKGDAFRKLLRKHAGEIVDLPEGSFKESGTMVRAVRITAWGAA